MLSGKSSTSMPSFPKLSTEAGSFQAYEPLLLNQIEYMYGSLGIQIANGAATLLPAATASELPQLNRRSSVRMK